MRVTDEEIIFCTVQTAISSSTTSWSPFPAGEGFEIQLPWKRVVVGADPYHGVSEHGKNTLTTRRGDHRSSAERLKFELL